MSTPSTAPAMLTEAEQTILKALLSALGPNAATEVDSFVAGELNTAETALESLVSSKLGPFAGLMSGTFDKLKAELEATVDAKVAAALALINKDAGNPPAAPAAPPAS